MLNRVEQVVIKMQLDKSAYDRHSEALKTLSLCPKQMIDGDCLKTSYALAIEYFGTVAKNLEAVAHICDDPAVVIAASCEVLTQGKLLIYEALKKLERVIEIVEARDA